MRSHKRKPFLITLYLTFILIIITLAAGCTGNEAAEPDQVTVILDWTPNTNHSGLFAAIDKGYFEEENLEVEIIQAPGSVVQMVAAGQAEFGVSYQEEITYARLSGMPVVSIAAVIQHNTSGFASLKERGIETPADFEGKSYGGWGSPVEEATIKALMERYDADFEKVDIITTGEVDSLIVIEREADFAWIYYGWTGIEAELKGMELNFIELGKEDPALDYYTPTLITSEALISENPDLINRFMRAVGRGYRLAIENPAEAVEILLNQAPELDEDLAKASQEWLSERYQADAETWGLQKKETWEAYSRWLYKNGLIEEMPDAEKCFTNEFVQ
ncbi:MAG: ABC transporter substrate-binding protein [Bacillota bacterium]|nr:ABC transporter substrate-binding protein [Bacillota bacterium]